ncbi:hypothetical protein MSAN_00186700 [Mycena sanguinolenta]|uniref:F-box domain-containing protein n=1 Tax=Mycena sanguinolenta TaxID=230812 RepID=A0A8H6ZHH9_9AGAR|nr:hypothetical protein MSAN_00186700 [Mycena sanguinolenta]
MSVVAQFPHELMDNILIHHAEDSACLKACSLVCRAWFFSSRSLLFRTCLLLPKNIRRFRDLVHSPVCTILPHIRKLAVYRNSFHADDGCFNGVADKMRHLTHIHTLDMGLYIDPNASDAHLNAFFCTGFMTAFTHITSLNLTCDYGGGDSQASPLFDMMGLFPALQVLEVRGIYGTLAEPQTCMALPRDLRSLVLGETSVGLVFRWMHRAGHLPILESLTLPRVRRLDIPSVREALLYLGNTLRHLIIDLSRSHSDSLDVHALFDLSLLRNLRTLSIRDATTPRRRTRSNPAPMLMLIRGLVAPALESFSLDLDLQLYRHLDWAALDSFLSPVRFPRLQKVVCRCRHSPDGLFLRKALPLLEASGVLLIQNKCPGRIC